MPAALLRIAVHEQEFRSACATSVTSTPSREDRGMTIISRLKNHIGLVPNPISERTREARARRSAR